MPLDNFFENIFILLTIGAGLFAVLVVYYRIATTLDVKRVAKKYSRMPKIILRKNSFIISTDKKQEFISWDKIKEADYVKDFIIIKFTSGRKLKLSRDNYLNFIFLFKTLPENVKVTGKFSKIHKIFFSNLKKCEICGYVSVKNEICLVCGNETYEKLVDNFEVNLPEKEKYIQQSKKNWDYARKSIQEERQIIPFSL